MGKCLEHNLLSYSLGTSKLQKEVIMYKIRKGEEIKDDWKNFGHPSKIRSE